MYLTEVKRVRTPSTQRLSLLPISLRSTVSYKDLYLLICLCVVYYQMDVLIIKRKIVATIEDDLVRK